MTNPKVNLEGVLVGFTFDGSPSVCMECAAKDAELVQGASKVWGDSEHAADACEWCDVRLDGKCRECDGEGLVTVNDGRDPQMEMEVACDECRGAGS